MKRTIRIWITRLFATGVFFSILLLSILLNPGLLYANKTVVDNYTVYHSSQIDDDIIKRLETVTMLLEQSALYDPSFKLEICLNDGSFYPTLLEKVRGQAFAWGFYNKVVLQGKTDFKNNRVQLNGYSWNSEQLIAHEAIHCYQYNRFGLWGSNPIANYPIWKWEGYPEYVSRQNLGQLNLYENIERLLKTTEEDNKNWAIEFADGTISPVNYYKDWLLVSYCIDIKDLSYKELLNDSLTKDLIEKEMHEWFEMENKKQTPNNSSVQAPYGSTTPN